MAWYGVQHTRKHVITATVKRCNQDFNFFRFQFQTFTADNKLKILFINIIYQFTLHSDNRSSTISNAAVCRMVDTLSITHIQRLGDSKKIRKQLFS